MFLTIKIRLFTTTTTFQHIVTILSLRNQPHCNTYSCNSLLPPKIINYLLLLHIKFYEKQVSLISKLQPLSYQFTSSITPCLPRHASQPTPKIYNATALLCKLTHAWKHRRPNIHYHSVLFYLKCLF